MRTGDVIVVGAGPAGTTCAEALERAGADVILLDRERFPRDKACAGWVTPAVFAALGLSPDDYRADGCTLQPFTSFETSVMGRGACRTSFGRPVSYGVRRAEFDTFLLERVRARTLESTPLTALRRDGRHWVVNDSLSAPVVVGAAGHFCPVARRVRAASPERIVLARNVEVRLGPGERCGIDPETPELYFCRDLEGYGWCLRKGDYLNVGIGRRKGADFRAHVVAFAGWLRTSGKVPDRVLDWRHWNGHAYVLAGDGGPVVADGLVLVGDAAGLAARESGEGIGPAIESGTRAAAEIAAGSSRDFDRYAAWVRSRGPVRTLGSILRSIAPPAAGRALLASPRYAQRVVEDYFLRSIP